MPSDLKSETARINGAKSRGPITEAGKAASSQNAIKHGMTARNTCILECENADEFNAFLAEHIAIHQPATPPEAELVEQMAIARWRIRRFVHAETVLIDSEITRNRDKVEKEFATLGCSVHIAMAIRSLADESHCLSLMSRYESRHQRTHDKAYAALRELQESRVSPAPEPPSAPSEKASPEATLTAANPSASEPTASPENKKSPNEPSAAPSVSPGIHLCPPTTNGNSEDYDG